jgi:hypothetical protein
MGLSRLVSVLLVSLMIAGCPVMNQYYLAQPLVITATGPFTHAASGMTFPIAVGDFQRATIHQFDEQGRNIGVGYNLFDPPYRVSTSVYVYPSPTIKSFMSPEEVIAAARVNIAAQVYELEKQQLTQAHSDVRLIDEKEITQRQMDSTYSGMQVTFEYEEISDSESRSVRTYLFLFCYVASSWTIKYRITHLKDYDASRQIDRFLNELRWTLIDS